MYLFVFLWVPFLQEAARDSGRDRNLPLGFIFSSFMVSMTLGSVLYTCIVSLSRLDAPSPHPDSSGSGSGSAGSSEDTAPTASPISSHERAITLHAQLSAAVCVLSALAFTVAIANRHEHVRFWAFCAYELSVGVYYPVLGMLRGRLVEDEHRATVRPFLFCCLLHHCVSHVRPRTDAEFSCDPALISLPCPAQRIRHCIPPCWSRVCAPRRACRVRRAAPMFRARHLRCFPSSHRERCQETPRSRQLASEMILVGHIGCVLSLLDTPVVRLAP